LFDRLPALARKLQAKVDETAPSRPWRWLLIALGPSRDALHITPLLSALRRGFPSVELDVLVNGDAVPLLAQNPDLHTVMSVSGTLAGRSSIHHESMSIIQAMRRLHARRYEVAIDLTDTVVSAALTLTTGAGVRIGYRTASTVSKWLKRATCYTHMIMARPDRQDRVRHYLLHIGTALGLDGPGPERPDPVTPEGEHETLPPVHQGRR
jgi:heptosyltransferase-3